MKLFRTSMLAIARGQFRAVAEAERLKQFSSFFYEAKKKQDSEKEEANRNIVDTGRPWRTDELRIKSNEDLHKLWYVLLREKNTLLADACIYEKLAGEKMPQNRLGKVERAMARLQTVVAERKGVRGQFRRHLEHDYAQQLRAKLAAENEAHKLEARISPPITFTLLRAKYAELIKGKDDQEYLQQHVAREVSREKHKQYLREKYDYRRKRVVNAETADPERLGKLGKDDYILTFKNSIEEQLKSNQSRVSQEEILRAHVRNWRMLDLKQRRVVLNYLNARRSRDAKSAFIKELNLLAQKIAYEEKNLTNTSP